MPNSTEVKNGDIISLRVGGPCGMTFEKLLVRVSPDFKLEVHIDTDEANACGLGPTTPLRTAHLIAPPARPPHFPFHPHFHFLLLFNP
jgi:putative phosphotransacetylase